MKKSFYSIVAILFISIFVWIISTANYNSW